MHILPGFYRSRTNPQFFIVVALLCHVLAISHSLPVTDAGLRDRVQQCKNIGWDASRSACLSLSDLDTSQVTDMSSLFASAPGFDIDISRWNTGSVVDMGHMFEDASDFNADISRWDTSRVTDMRRMLSSAPKFNADISQWNTENVNDMSGMFSQALVFNVDLSRWNTSQVMDMEHMFSRADNFNADISRWDTARVTSMFGMFAQSAINQNLSQWDVSAVTDMGMMFFSALAFNGDLSTWDTSRVTNMDTMFNRGVFNTDISRWDTSRVRYMGFMFSQQRFFNADISGWDVSSVLNFGEMFYRASSFNVDLCSWEVNTFSLPLFFESPKLSLCDVDECRDSRNTCHAQAQCTNTDGSFTCVCSAGYGGNGLQCSDIDECVTDPEICGAGFECNNNDGSFECQPACTTLSLCLERGGIVSDSGKCFFVPQGVTGTWQQARLSCEQEGSNLASVRSAAENDIVNALWNSNDRNIPFQREMFGGMWLGATDEAQEGSFAWTDNTPVTFTAWANVYGQQQPNNYNGQDCVSYGYSANNQWINEDPVAGWVDNDCSITQHFVCEISCDASSSASNSVSAPEVVAGTSAAQSEQKSTNSASISLAGGVAAAVGAYLLGGLSVFVAMKVFGHARNGRGDSAAAPAVAEAGEGPKTFERTPKAQFMFERMRRASARAFSSSMKMTSHATRLEEQAGSAQPV